MTVLLIAHGSPDARHRSGLAGLVAAARTALAPERVEIAYLEHDAPSPEAIAADLAAGERVTVVPLLLTPAYHARVDIPAAAAALEKAGAEVTVTRALGPDPALLDAVAELVGSGPVVLVAGGSSDGNALRGLKAQLAADIRRPDWHGAALSDRRALTGLLDQLVARHGTVTLAPFTLAEGVLSDRVREVAAARGLPHIPGELARTRAVQDLVVHRVWESRAPARRYDPAEEQI
ncbi:sirohydrochlorin chelatase [Janibacter sp. GXQ6167]|uniref:sirohydrochlorin chelatase n=1 Tax=Janibacter sp. GXQ6167 TaxID=3240791 RepID=UPI0035235383